MLNIMILCFFFLHVHTRGERGDPPLRITKHAYFEKTQEA